MEKAGNVLGRVLKKHDIAKVSALGRLANSWPSLVGASVAAHTMPVDLRNRVLFLSVDSPVWMQQLSFLKSQLLENLRDHGVEDIIFRLGRVTRTTGPSDKKHGIPVNKKTLSGQELAFVDECAAGVEDAGLRQSIQDLLNNALSRASGGDQGKNSE